jgi:hypothetical protein
MVTAFGDPRVERLVYHDALRLQGPRSAGRADRESAEGARGSFCGVLSERSESSKVGD